MPIEPITFSSICPRWSPEVSKLPITQRRGQGCHNHYKPRSQHAAPELKILTNDISSCSSAFNKHFDLSANFRSPCQKANSLALTQNKVFPRSAQQLHWIASNRKNMTTHLELLPKICKIPCPYQHTKWPAIFSNRKLILHQKNILLGKGKNMLDQYAYFLTSIYIQSSSQEQELPLRAALQCKRLNIHFTQKKDLFHGHSNVVMPPSIFTRLCSNHWKVKIQLSTRVEANSSGHMDKVTNWEKS